ncbi:MAG: 2-oxo acid dehydrogenase subunit E2 [Acidobacteria bacterium]|nr:2-oxo acid dehydrogenase subunit E2 [Acidobacteriota bacterium]
MSELKSFKLPDVGEGLTEAEVVSWHVKVGDVVAVNDVICEIETAKSLVELPSPFAGRVEALLVPEGEVTPVGTEIIRIATGSADSVGSVEEPDSASEPEVNPAPLVGSGPKADAVKRRARKFPLAGVTTEAPVPASANGDVSSSSARPLAKPPVRKAAKDLGIDLAEVMATGVRGEVTKKDLLSHQEQRSSGASVQQAASGRSASSGQASPGQRIERIPVKGVRKATATAVAHSAFTAPHVSIFLDVDATRTMEFVARLKASRDFAGIRVSPLLIVARAVIWAAQRNPGVNASWTDDEILVKHFVNLGIAAATPRGLMVPNIKDAQNLSLKELAVAIGELTATAREGKTQPAQMSEGTLTITNIGALGLDTGTPILNRGEVAILAFGTIKQKPWVVDGAVVPRWITTLGGSFDHRVVDGDLSARFLTDVAAILEEPALLLD